MLFIYFWQILLFVYIYTHDDPLLLAHHAVAKQPHSGADHYGILLGNVLIMSTLGHV